MGTRLALEDLMDESRDCAIAAELQGEGFAILQESGSSSHISTNSRQLIRFVDSSDPDSQIEDRHNLPRARDPNAQIALDTSFTGEFVQNSSLQADHASVSDDPAESERNSGSPSSGDDQEGSAIGSDRWIVMNVGGTQLETTVETLCMDSESMLAAWVLRHRRDDTRELRIDRDGQRFVHVLNYLRDGTLWLEDLPSLRGIYEEAKFYQLRGLQRLCEDRMLEVEARQAAESKRRKEDIEEALKAAFFRWERDHNKAYTSPKGKNEVLVILRGRRLRISEPPRFDMNADF